MTFSVCTCTIFDILIGFLLGGETAEEFYSFPDMYRYIYMYCTLASSGWFIRVSV